MIADEGIGDQIVRIYSHETPVARTAPISKQCIVQRLKPKILWMLFGTTEVVPFHKAHDATRSSPCAIRPGAATRFLLGLSVWRDEQREHLRRDFHAGRQRTEHLSIGFHIDLGLGTAAGVAVDRGCFNQTDML